MNLHALNRMVQFAVLLAVGVLQSAVCSKQLGGTNHVSKLKQVPLFAPNATTGSAFQARGKATKIRLTIIRPTQPSICRDVATPEDHLAAN